MALNFPSNPNTNDYHVESGRIWQWNGTYWARIPDPGSQGPAGPAGGAQGIDGRQGVQGGPCLLYTSDAADE